MRQIVRELYFRAFLVSAVVLEDEVHQLRAVVLKVAVFVPQPRVYLASSLLRLVGVVVDSLVHQDVECPLQWGPFSVCHGLGCLGERSRLSFGRHQHPLRDSGWPPIPSLGGW